MIGAESKLARRTQHAVRDFAADLALLQLDTAGKDRPGPREWIERADRDDRRAADDVQQLAAPVVDPGYPERVPVRVTPGLNDAADHDPGEVLTEALDAIHRRDVRRQQVAQFCGAPLVGNDLPQPIVRDQHEANCSRKRTSESYSRRMSLMPYRDMAIRAGPIPKAQPE